MSALRFVGTHFGDRCGLIVYYLMDVDEVLRRERAREEKRGYREDTVSLF